MLGALAGFGRIRVCSLVVGQIVLYDSVNYGTCLAGSSSCIDYDMRVHIQGQSLSRVQSNQKDPSILTSQISLTGQYAQACAEGVGWTFPIPAFLATPMATERRWANQALK